MSVKNKNKHTYYFKKDSFSMLTATTVLVKDVCLDLTTEKKDTYFS